MRPISAAASALAILLLFACATGASQPRGERFDILSMQRKLDERGIGFGISRVPGEDAVLLHVRFRGADAAGGVDATPEEAAAAAAPEGCTLKSIEPAGEGTVKATYSC